MVPDQKPRQREHLVRYLNASPNRAKKLRINAVGLPYLRVRVRPQQLNNIKSILSKN